MPNHPTPEPEQEPAVLELLLAHIDEHCRLLSASSSMRSER